MKIENNQAPTNSWQLQYLSKELFPQWDKFIDSSPQATIYGKSWYLAALQCSFQILVVKKETEIIGGIVLTKSNRENYVNPFLCKYLGIYYANFSGNEYNQETKRRKVAKLVLAELVKLPSFDYYFHPSFKTYLPFYFKKFANRLRYSYWINLKEQSMEQIKSKFHTKLRSELKFAKKNNYVIEKDIDPEIFITICQKTFLQKGNKFPFTKPFLRHYFESLKAQNALQILGIKEENGEIMAVAGLLKSQETTSLILNGFDAVVMKRGANELLIVECIKLAKTQSDFFDFEGSMIPSIESFYRKFGGEYVPYLNIYKDTFRKYLIEKLRSWR